MRANWSIARSRARSHTSAALVRAVPGTGSERASGTVSDATWTVFSDRNRQRLRAAVIEAEHAQASALNAMRSAIRTPEAAQGR